MQRSLQNGVNQLARAGNDKALLGMALINLHAALETYLRKELASEISLYEASEEKKHTTWPDLINLWENNRGLPRSDRDRLFQHNSLRNAIAHGDPFTISRSQVEAYARFVQEFTGVRVKAEKTGKTPRPTAKDEPIPPIATPPDPPRPSIVKNRGCSCIARLVATGVAIFLLIIGYLAVNSSLFNEQSPAGEQSRELLEEIRSPLATPGSEENKLSPENEDAEATAVPPTTSSSETNKTTIRVNQTSNVRLGPSMDEGAIDVAPGGAEYDVLETSPDGDWYKIELASGKVGWIGSTRVTVIAP